ncbi:hypothetical protein [Ancylobacter sp. TS-1]|uniref:hypothetical protein n=1 Tax=Ancylobacter sp. TS-1 TaxID=1850374 RepID=UPI001265BA69|nr:hypothetical protein [Ancylobacter sp. TS-1]QFR34704.1 hypothetical protein GBB76_17230 [Ancylobacter sp. TS-1]
MKGRTLERTIRRALAKSERISQADRRFFAASADLAGSAEDVTDFEAAAIFSRIDKGGFTDRLAQRAAEAGHAG